METKSFGHYLVQKGLISESDLEKALLLQNKSRLLGQIAVEANFLKPEDIREIMDFAEKHPGIKFGEAAVSLGLLNSNQLRYLLDIRTRLKVRISQILTDNGFLSVAALHNALMDFNLKRKKLDKILVVQQSRMIIRIIESSLKKHGYTVFTAGTGEEACRMMEEITPDIMIVGGILKDMSGFEICRKILANPGIKSPHFVMLSSDDSLQNIEKSFEVGIQHFLKKPVTEAELINLIYQIERETVEKRKEKILVVDDSRGARSIIRGELLSMGLEVRTAENGSEGLKIARTLQPDIITMDIEMPEMDGFEACRQLKEDPQTRNIPVILISSPNSASLVERGFEVGAVEYFTKPFKPGSLASYIDMLLESKKIKKQCHILVAEDSKTTQHIIQYLLNKNGYSVQLANNGAEALQLLPQCSPDLIITDCYMPEMDGFTFTSAIKKMPQYRHVPVIMLTGAHKKEDMLRGLAFGAGDYIVKPFDEAELLARMSVHVVNKNLFDEIEDQKGKLEQSNREKSRLLSDLSALNKMVEQLHLCRSQSQTYPVMAQSMIHLCPESSGALFLWEEESATFITAAQWGENGEHIHCCPAGDICLVLQHNHEYIFNAKNTVGARCPHLSPESCSACLCIPFGDRGNLFGIIHVRFAKDKSGLGFSASKGSKDADAENLLKTVAEHYRMTLSNLQYQESLREQSIRDPLTKLYNRRYLNENIEREIAQADRTSASIGVIMLDVDHFKTFNDTNGHLAGDTLLAELGALLRKNSRKMDITCRYGGEEFLLLLPGGNRETCSLTAERIRTEVEKRFNRMMDGKRLGPVTISLGVATYPENGADSRTLISAADGALYQAKRTGRNRFVLAPSTPR